MNFDHMKKIVPGWTHVDWDADHILDDGECVIHDSTGERFVITSNQIKQDPAIPAVPDHAVSSELMTADTWEEAEGHLTQNGSQGVIYQKKDGSWACREVASKSGEIDWKNVKTALSHAVGIPIKKVFPVKRDYDVASGSGFSPTTASHEWNLTLRSVGDSKMVNALWRSGQLTLSSGIPSMSGAMSFHDVIGTVDDEHFYYENPMSETYLDYDAAHGGLPGLAKSKARSDLPVVAGKTQGAYATEEALLQDVQKSGYGSFLSFQLPTGEWAFRVIRVKNAAGDLCNVSYITKEELARVTQTLNLPYSRHCSSQISNVKYSSGFEVDSGLLSRDERLAEVNFMLGERYGEALASYLDTISNERTRSYVLDSVLKSKQPKIEIQDLLARSMGMSQRSVFAPTGASNGKKVYFFNSASIMGSGVMRDLFSLDENGLIHDDIDRLRAAGFEVVVVQCSSSKDLVEAMYADSTAGVIWFGHAGPGTLASSHGFGIDLRSEIDWSRVSPSLKGFQILGCQFTASFESVDEDACTEKTIRDYFPDDVYVTGYDRYMLSFDLPIQKTASDGIAKTVAEIIARTPKPVEIETDCVGDDGLPDETEGSDWTDDSEEYCE